MKPTKRLSVCILASLLAVWGAGCGGDDSPAGAVGPRITYVSPENLAADVPLNTGVAATFSEAMDPTSLTDQTFTLVLEGDLVTPVAGMVYATDVNALFTPDGVLPASSVYTATITSGALSMAGVALAADYVWSFSTGLSPDTTPPLVVLVDPVADEGGVGLSKKLTVTFSEAMSPSTLSADTFTLEQDSGPTPVAGTVILTGTIATFTPSAALPAMTDFTARVKVGAEDLAGNPLPDEYVWSFTTGAAPLPLVPLGSASTFAVLAGTAITNVSPSVITGDIGVHPGATVSGFTDTDVVDGTITVGTDALIPVKEDLVTAYLNAENRVPVPEIPFLNPGTPPGDLGGQILGPGLYKITSVTSATSNFTLHGGADDVWIFQLASSLTVSAGVVLELTGGALAKNVFWQVGSSATLEGGCEFKGTLIALTAITLVTGAKLEGRALARDAAVVLGANVISVPVE